MNSYITTAIILDTRSTKKTGKHPVKLRVIHERTAKYCPLNIDLFEDEWEKVISEKPRGLYKELKLKLSRFENKANDIINDMPVYSFPAFQKLFTGKRPKEITLYNLFETIIENLYNEERVGTAISYQDAMKSIKKFSPSLEFHEITKEWLFEYENWMLSHGKSLTTVGIYLRALRVVLNEAITKGKLPKEAYPFGRKSYQIPAGHNAKKALKLSEIKKIIEYQPDHTTWEAKARDFWILSYLCNGANMKDIARLKYKHIDSERIVFIRAKTQRSTRSNQKPIVVYLSPEIKAIIETWGQKPIHPEKYVFDILVEGVTPKREKELIQQATKNVNTWIKRIAKAVEIQDWEKITTYWARHSFSTVLKRSGASTEFISESLGHKDLRTTENYLDSFEDDMKKQYAKALTDFGDE